MTEEQYKKICDLLTVIITNQTLILNQQCATLGRTVGLTSDEEIKALIDRTMVAINSELDMMSKT